MGSGQGCCSHGHKPEEQKLATEAKYGTSGGKNKQFFKRQSTSLTLTANANIFYGNLVISCVGKGKCKSEFSGLCLSLQQNIIKGDENKDEYKKKKNDNNIFINN
eukprot:819781_1